MTPEDQDRIAAEQDMAPKQMNTLDELALKVAKEVYLPDGERLLSGLVEDSVIQYFAHCLVAELAKQDTVAWMTHHDEPMLFLTQSEAFDYCKDDEPPIPLFAAPAIPQRQQIEGCMWAVTKGDRTICQPPKNPKPVIPAGWVMVPQSMVEEICACCCQWSEDHAEAMLAAAPKGK